MRWSEIDAIPCPVAQTMAVIGDAWTVLIVRDCFKGATKFDEFQRATGASRAILADRLARLVEHGVLARTLYEDHPPRHEYRLTARGRALQPVLMALSNWSEANLPGKTKSLGRRHTICGHRFTPVIACSECGEPVTPDTVTYDKAPGKKQPA
jgi:DNA-binding HxlR family transcriptional regulator